jgi:hypothetical protein
MSFPEYPSHSSFIRITSTWEWRLTSASTSETRERLFRIFEICWIYIL